MSPRWACRVPPLVDIVIPHHGVDHSLVELCRRCLWTIWKHSERSAYRVILVDNASPLGSIAQLLHNLPHLLIRNTENVGFVKATNQGIQASTAPYVVLMNNDTEAVPRWLDKLRAGFVHDKVAAVGPLTTTPHSWQGAWRPKKENPYLITRHTKRHTMLAFFCVMIRREALDDVGLLDEDFGVGFGDDDAWCHKARQAGWDLALQQELRIPHAHRSTFKTLFSDDAMATMQDSAMDMVKAKCNLR